MARPVGYPTVIPMPSPMGQSVGISMTTPPVVLTLAYIMAPHHGLLLGGCPWSRGYRGPTPYGAIQEINVDHRHYSSDSLDFTTPTSCPPLSTV